MLIYFSFYIVDFFAIMKMSVDSNLEKLTGQTWCKENLIGERLPNFFTLKFTAREKLPLEANWMRYFCCNYVNIYSVFERITFCDSHVKY